MSAEGRRFGSDTALRLLDPRFRGDERQGWHGIGLMVVTGAVTLVVLRYKRML